MAKTTAAKKSVQVRKPAAKTPGKKAGKPAGKASGAAAKKAKPAAKKPARKHAAPPRRPTSGTGSGGAAEFIVQVGADYLTVEYGGTTTAYDIVLFVKDEEQERMARDFVESLGLRQIAVAKAYGRP